MLGDTSITTLVAVKDLGEAMAFYEERLQLARTDESSGWVQYRMRFQIAALVSLVAMINASNRFGVIFEQPGVPTSPACSPG